MPDTKRTSKPRLTGQTRRDIRAYLAQRDGARCFYCRAPFAADLAGATLDHYIPHCLWPVNKPRNLRLACEPCNQTKADLLPWPIAMVVLAAAASTGTPAGTPVPAVPEGSGTPEPGVPAVPEPPGTGVPGHPIRSADRPIGRAGVSRSHPGARRAGRRGGRPTGSGAPSGDRSADRLGWGVLA